MAKALDVAVIVSSQGTHLYARFNDGTSQSFADVYMLVDHLYELRIQPEQVRAIDWHDDFDQELPSGTKIALLYGLRRRYMAASQDWNYEVPDDFMENRANEPPQERDLF